MAPHVAQVAFSTLSAPLSQLSQLSPRCEEVWDGMDFTPCFRHRYLANVPLALVCGTTVVYLALLIRRKLGYSLRPARTTTASLISPDADYLVKLEADVLLGALGETLLHETDAEANGGAKGVMSSRENEKVINDFRADMPPGAKRWANVRYYVALTASVIWTMLEVAAWYFGGDWRHIIFPAFLTGVAALSGPVTPLVTVHLIPGVLLFRSAVIHSAPWPTLIPTIFELVFWSALSSLPYYDRLDRLLAGAVSHGGIGYPESPAHLEEPTSVLSRGTYWFIIPFLWKHYWKPVTLSDIPGLREDDGAAANAGAFRAHRARRDKRYEEKNGKQRVRDLGIDLITFFTPLVIVQTVWALIFTVLQYLPPIGLRKLLQYIQTRDQPTHVAVVYIAMMCIGQSVGIVAFGQALMGGRRVCVRMRSIVIAEVFTKALRRQDRSGAVNSESDESEEQAESSSDGKVSNLVSVDAFNISEACAYIFYIFSCPFGIAINLVLLYETLGAAAFAGVAVLVLLIPLQTLMGKLFTLFQNRLMTATDKRLDDVTEVISFIKLIKYNSWQDKFLERMAATRKQELTVLAQRFSLIVFFNVLVWGTPVLVTAAAFGVHVLVLDQPLTADRAFASLVLFNMLRDPLAMLQETITQLLQAYTSCCRIQDFLNEPDTLKYSQVSTPGPSDPSIGFRDALFAYPGSEVPECSADAQPFRLGELDLSFPTGKLSVVTGPVGSGKSTLILSLLGETTLLKGKVFMPDDKANRDLCPADPATGLTDTTAYCAQTAWLVGATIRQNIVFGASWDRQRYDAVVHACALERDFEIFDLGDETEVGEKGTTCSGGQKARIALARAVYSSAKIIILDDILSAVDAQTARHIHTHVLQGPLMAGRTCILVTHAVNLVVPSSAFVVMLDDGKVVASGTPNSLFASGALDLESETPSEAEPQGAPAATVHDEDETIEENLDGQEHDALVAKKAVDAQEAAVPKTSSDKQLVQKESTLQGSVGFATYALYFRSMGNVPFWILLVFCFVGTQGLQVLTNAWVKEWAEAAKRAFWGGEDRSTTFYLVVYLIISAFYIFGIAARMAITFVGSLHASSRLYNRMLKRILGAKMRFFDSTPSGRIMNRLSKDMSSIDQQAAEIIALFVNCVLSCMAVLAVVAYSTPPFLIALVFIIFLYWAVGTLYVTTNREIKRIDSVTRSPLFVSFSEALVGMSTIRSYGDSARFIRKLVTELDTNTKCFWYLWQANRVLNNLSNFVGTLVTVSASVLALNATGMSAGAAGLSITYALSFTEYVLWVVRLYASAEMTMNSVERVGEYLDLPVEEEDMSKGAEPPAYWPSREGFVVVENLTCKYAPQLDPVLRDVSFTIGPREKIGICGRTGSGKSTLALSFFRFLHQESGRIVIDGQDIGKLSLNTLRSRLTILPQEAQLFSGTIRDNMDPFNQHEDQEIWEALRNCGLCGRTPGASLAPSRAASRSASVAAVADLAEPEERVTIRSLGEPVAVGGKNFSQGQRQLLALARGLLKLRTSSFLIMDESTANLDHATDATIQNVLRTNLADTQMLVIAHRLMTVCGLDKILVLDHGRVIEFGTPWELLQDEAGSFRDLCRQSGEEAQLFELAKGVHERKTEKATTSL